MITLLRAIVKTDVKQAFRLIPVRPSHWHLLGIFWHDHYYVDKCLPFGLCYAPFLFNRVAEAFHWILDPNYSMTHLIQYLDDFFTAGAGG